MNFSTQCTTTWKNVSGCVPQRGILFHVVSHNTNIVPHCIPQRETKLKDLKIVPRCIPQRGIFFHIVSHNVEHFFALYPQHGKIVQRCGTQRGKWPRVCPTTWENLTSGKIAPWCVPQRGNCSAVCPTAWKIARCGIQRGKKSFSF
jgi:hypothetical protein